MIKKTGHPTKDFIDELIYRCNRYECPEISSNTSTICRKNCPIVKECVNKFGVDLITI